MKLIVCSPDGDKGFFYIVVGILPKDTLSPSLLIICLGYLLQTSIDKKKNMAVD